MYDGGGDGEPFAVDGGTDGFQLAPDGGFATDGASPADGEIDQ